MNNSEMTDDEFKKNANGVFEQYWMMTKLTFGSAIGDNLKEFARIIFVAGYLEGVHNEE